MSFSECHRSGRPKWVKVSLLSTLSYPNICLSNEISLVLADALWHREYWVCSYYFCLIVTMYSGRDKLNTVQVQCLYLIVFIRHEILNNRRINRMWEKDLKKCNLKGIELVSVYNDIHHVPTNQSIIKYEYAKSKM